MQVQDNRLSSFRDYFEKSLKRSQYTDLELRPLFKRLCEDLLGLSSSQIMLANDTLLTESEILKLLSATKELKSGRPVQYIIGHTEFLELEIKCDERGLIPRPETEELARWIIDSHPSLSAILDIGTGTGCIALALKNHFPDSSISAMDYQKEALELADENSRLLDLAVALYHDDISDPKLEYGRFQLIVSNPPYVLRSESSTMRTNVTHFEPHSALFVQDDDPLRFYKAILNFSAYHLLPGGWLYFEINEKFGPEMAELMAEKRFSDIEVKKDLYGKDRMLRGSLLNR